MSATGSTLSLDPTAGTRSVVFHRPAELVDISERIYRQVFAVGLWVAAGLSAFAAVSSLLHPDTGSQLRGFVICAAFAAACVVGALHPAPVYRTLRRQPSLLLGAGVGLGVGSWFVGLHNFQLFMPLIAIIGVAGIATPRRVVIAAAVVAGIGLAMPHVVDGDGNLSGPLAVVVPPLLFWFIVDRIAGFALRLHQSSSDHGETQHSDTSGSDGPDDAAVPASMAPRTPAPRRTLPAPRINVIDGIPLTGRQLQVVLLVCEGLRHDEIARCLEIGVPTVRRHLEKARRHVGVDTTAELVAWSCRVGLVPAAG